MSAGRGTYFSSTLFRETKLYSYRDSRSLYGEDRRTAGMIRAYNSSAGQTPGDGPASAGGANYPTSPPVPGGPQNREGGREGLQPMVLGNSVYAFDEETGLVGHGLSGPRVVDTLMELNPFLAQLPGNLRQDLIGMTLPRQTARGDQLRGSHTSMVYIVLSGCVIEESMYGESTNARILGTGAVLGAAEVFDRSFYPPVARALNTTMSLVLPMKRIRMVAEAHPHLTLALGRTLAEQITISEQVYSRHVLPTEERLAGLFVHLLDRCAVPCPMYGRMIEGPSQYDLSLALSVSRASVENALRLLRKKKLVSTGYRQYRFPDERKLADFGKVRKPSQTVTGSAATDRRDSI